MRSDLLSNHLDVIGNIHHAFAVHWRFSTKLFSSISIQGSLSGMPQSLVIASSYALYSISLENILCIHLM
jgi:hypothetical protein